MSDFRFRALISVVFQPLCPACSLFLFRRINDDDDESQHWFKTEFSVQIKLWFKTKVKYYRGKF